MCRGAVLRRAAIIDEPAASAAAASRRAPGHVALTAGAGRGVRRRSAAGSSARAREKRALMAAFDAATATTRCRSTARCDRRAAALPARDGDAASYEPARQILLDNMPSQHGPPGYRVLTPFRRDGGGTTPARGPRLGAARRDRASCRRLRWTPVRARSPAGSTTCRYPGVRVGDARRDGRGGLAAGAQFPDARPTSRRRSANRSSRGSCCSTHRARRVRARLAPVVGFPPERHLGYAIQWFALALALRRRLRRDEPRASAHREGE